MLTRKSFHRQLTHSQSVRALAHSKSRKLIPRLAGPPKGARLSETRLILYFHYCGRREGDSHDQSAAAPGYRGVAAPRWPQGKIVSARRIYSSKNAVRLKRKLVNECDQRALISMFNPCLSKNIFIFGLWHIKCCDPVYQRAPSRPILLRMPRHRVVQPPS